MPEGWEECEQAEHHFCVLRGRGGDEASVRRYYVRGGPIPPSQSLSRAHVLNELRRRVHLCIAEHAQDRIFLHAGVVAWHGYGLLFPGRTHAGKSTLTASLVQSGATYYSDEYAVMGNNGRIYPFPFPIRIRENGGTHVTVPASQTGKGPLRADLILFTRYLPNQGCNPRPVEPGQTVLRLMKNSISMRRSPAAVLRVLKTLALETSAYAGDRGEACQVLEWLKTIYLSRSAASYVVG